MKTELLSPEEAQAFLDNFEPEKPSTPTDLTSIEDKDIRANQEIIDAANKMIKERITNNDKSLRLTDIISAKSEAFKQLRTLQGLEESEIDTSKLIPTQINIAIINN